MRDIRKALQDGSVAIGSWINTASPIVAELMAACNFDFLTVDAEHSATHLAQVQVLFQAIRSGNPNCAPMVRLPGNDYAATKRYLDAGAVGVVAPLINSAVQAQELIRSVKYAPQGARGVGFCRANMYGTRFEEAVASANEETMVCVQIEHIDGVEEIDQILSVPGVDAVFIGPYDLSASMGITGQLDNPRMLEATQRILSACQQHGVAPGIHVVQPDPQEAVRRIGQGYRLIAYSLDITMLAEACQSGLASIRRLVGNNTGGGHDIQ